MEPELIIQMYRSMLTIRLFEEKVKQLYQAGEITGAIHLSIGQEAVAVGVCSALRLNDAVFSTHRGHGHLIAKGGHLPAMMAELMGRQTGCSHGCGGSMHMFEPQVGFMGGNGIVGGGLALALGAAFAEQYRGRDGIAVAFFGDGAAQQGTFHEALNLAALWKLPYLAICENNQYAATTPVTAAVPTTDIAPRAAGYGIPGVVVDGNDCLAVSRAASAAVERARAGDGPTLLECKTYRVEPHCGIIADRRPKEELERWCRPGRDPLEHLKREGGLSDAAISAARYDVETQIETAVVFARGSPYPDPAAFLREQASI
ncbi:MAG: thiamine pyrophosphate-dependent dehydrogenase E1 component subunit alpha [Verrucomicrobiota bacterium]